MLKSFRKTFMNILLAREYPANAKNVDEVILEYPDRPKGLPIVDPTILVAECNEYIRRIKDQAIATPEIYNEFYLPMIHRFAAFVQLLPASQAHHHHDSGGLLRHSLEVGLRALELADRVLLTGSRTPRQRRDLEPRWQFAVFAAALCHDGGKPFFDLTVSNYERTLSWKPITEDLFTWGTTNKVAGCYIDWREGRGRQHTALGVLLMERIITSKALEWLELSGMDLVAWLSESLHYNPSPQNLIHDLVIKADQFSVERNLKSIGADLTLSHQSNIPVERYLIEVMKRLIKMGVWGINEPGSRVWKIDEHVYIVWPLGGEEMARETRLDNAAMAPRTADGILEFLIERNIAIIRNADAYLWEIVPDCIAAKLPNKSLFAIRLRSDALITTFPIPPIAGKLVSDVRNQAAIEAAYDKSITSPPIISEPENVVEVVCESEAPPAIKTTTPPPAPQESEQGNPSARSNSEAAAIAKKSKPNKPKGEVLVSEPSKPSIKPDKKKYELVAFEGAVGEALKALILEINDGSKLWDHDVFTNSSSDVFLKWPDAFSGYGLTSKAILGELTEKSWLCADPDMPIKKVLEVTRNDQTIKVLKLTPQVSFTFLSAIKITVKAQNNDQPIPFTTNVEPILDSVLASTQNTPSTSGAGIEQEQSDPKTNSQRVTVWQVIEILERLSLGKCPADENGWRKVSVITLARVDTDKSLDALNIDLFKFAQDYQNHLKVDKNNIRFKR